MRFAHFALVLSLSLGCSTAVRNFGGDSGGGGGASSGSGASSGGTQSGSGAGSAGGGPACAKPTDCPTGENGHATCTKGVCGFSCDKNFDDCDDKVGCETPTGADIANCGACGKTCAAYCSKGTCNDPVSLAAGSTSTCAILADASLYCWGGNSLSQLGDGTTNDVHAPVQITLPAGVVSVALGGAGLSNFPSPIGTAHTCAVLADGSVACWGANEAGQLGNGGNTPVTTAAASILPGFTAATQVCVGAQHTCVVDSGNNLSCWGSNTSGQLGNGSFSNTSTPTQVASNVATVACGGVHTCSIPSAGVDQRISCWGDDTDGELGNFGTSTDPSPGFVDSVTGASLLALGGAPKFQFAAGSSPPNGMSCAVAIGLSCWGNNVSGQLGLGSSGTNQTAPVAVSLPSVTSIAAASDFAAAVSNGTVFTWGNNAVGELGDGTIVAHDSPVAIGVTNAKQVVVGSAHGCALTAAGAVLCWGANDQGQLGDGTTVSRPAPTPVVWK